MDNFQFDQQDDDVPVENQEIHLDKIVPTADHPVNVTTNETTGLNEKDVPTVSTTTEEKDNEPFIVLYINLIRSRRFTPFDYEDDLYYDGIYDDMFENRFSNSFHHRDDFEFADY